MKKLLSRLPDKLANLLQGKNPQEISIRANKYTVIKEFDLYKRIDYFTTADEVEALFNRFCESSLYAYIDRIKSGFITVEGGHRIGICGSGVVKDGCIINFKEINSLNIRIAKEYIGCSDKLGLDIKNLLVISPPCCGKTTIIRDLARRLSKNHKVSIVDERGEIAGVSKGLSSFDVGNMTDVISFVPKQLGIEYVIRSMSPDYIVTDEISENDINILKKALSLGVNIIATAHGDDINKTITRLKLSDNCGVFNNIILLNNKNGVGTIEEVVVND